MLQTLREKPFVKKLVLSAVLVVMVLGIGIGVGGVLSDMFGTRSSSSSMTSTQGPWAMKIGDQTITPAAFQSELQSVSRQYEQMGMNQTPDFLTRVRFEAMQRIVRRAIETDMAKRAGLKVSNQELADHIVSMPELQRDGRFIGRDEYERILASNNVDVGSFESSLRDGLLIGKWEGMVGAGVIVTDKEIEEEFARNNQKVRFDFVLIDAAKYAPTAAPTDAEIKGYYDSHPDRYKRGEGRRAKYVLIDPKAAEAQIPAPADDELKKAYEADRTKYTGTFEQSRDEVRRQVIFQKAQVETDRRAAQFRSTVLDPASFEAAAAKAGLQVQDTGSVRRDSDSSALGPQFVEALFAAAPSSVNGPVSTLKGSAVFLLAGVEPARRATLDEAKADIRSDLSKDKGRDAALAAAKKAAVGAGGDLGSVAKSVGLSVQNGPLISKGEPVPSLGYDPAVESVAFATDQGSLAAPVVTAGGSVVVLKVVEKKTPDAATLASSRDSIASDLRRNRETALINSIVETAIKRTELKTNDEYFRQFGT